MKPTPRQPLSVLLLLLALCLSPGARAAPPDAGIEARIETIEESFIRINGDAYPIDDRIQVRWSEGSKAQRSDLQIGTLVLIELRGNGKGRKIHRITIQTE